MNTWMTLSSVKLSEPDHRGDAGSGRFLSATLWPKRGFGLLQQSVDQFAGECPPVLSSSCCGLFGLHARSATLTPRAMGRRVGGMSTLGVTFGLWYRSPCGSQVGYPPSIFPPLFALGLTPSNASPARGRSHRILIHLPCHSFGGINKFVRDSPATEVGRGIYDERVV